MNVPSRELMPVIRAALARGQRVRMTVTGSSMLPFIRDSDVVELEPIHSLPRRGDVVLVQCKEERYVLHRVLRRADDEFFLRGDAQEQWEGPFTRGDVLGKVVLSYRNGHRRVMDCGPWRFAGVIWARYGPFARWLLRLAVRVRAKGRGLRRRLQQASVFRA
jgi:signal peptidase